MATQDRIEFCRIINDALNPDLSGKDSQGLNIDSCLSMSRSEAALSIAECAYYGLLEPMEKLQAVYGGFADHSVVRNGGVLNVIHDGAVVGTQKLDSHYALFAVFNAFELDKLFDLVEKTEMPGLLEKNGLHSILMGSLGQSSFEVLMGGADENSTPHLPFDLPILSDCMINSPELVIALSQRDFDGFKYAFNDVLFWATPDMAADFADVVDDIKQIANACFSSRPVTQGPQFSVDFDRVSFYSSNGTLDDYEFHSIRLGLLGTGPNGCLSQCQLRAVNSYGSQAVRLGMDFKPGYVLCAAPLEFLQQFPSGQSSQAQMHLVAAYLNTVRPYRNTILGGGDHATSERRILNAYGSDAILYTGTEGDIAPAFYKHLPERIWDLVCENPRSSGYRVRALSAMHGHSVAPSLDANLTLDNLKMLSSHGYKFPDNTNLTIGAWPLTMSNKFASPLALEHVISMFSSGMTIAGVPVESSHAELMGYVDEFLGLKKTNKRFDRCAGWAIGRLVAQYDIAEFVAIASCDEHWSMLGDVYGVDALLPYIKKMPASTRTRIVTEDFNI